MSLRVPIAAATMSFGVLAEAVRELLQAEFEHGVGRGLWEGDKRETALVKCVVNISVKMGLILKATDFGIRYILGTWDFLHSQGILGYKLDGIYPHTLPRFPKASTLRYHSITNLPQLNTATRRSRPVRWPRDVRATAWLCVSVEPASWNAFSIQQYTTYCISCILRIVGDVGGTSRRTAGVNSGEGEGGRGERRKKKGEL